jgi:23S rRNA (uridine2552-2'-O)-methyltransferase
VEGELMARSKSSGRWLREHFDDPYVKQAQAEGWRSRAVYKLMELQDKYHLLRPGMTVVDLGAAPGGWSQYVLGLLGGQGRVIALDILEMERIEGVTIIQGDFTEDGPLAVLEAELNGRQVDLVLSDMAPNMSGMNVVDQPRSRVRASMTSSGTAGKRLTGLSYASPGHRDREAGKFTCWEPGAS